MTSTQVSYLFVPGAFHDPDCFDEVRAQLSSKGFESYTVALPSVGAEPPTTTLAEDATAVRNVLQRLIDQGKDVAVVAHSYGGAPAACAVETLGIVERQRAAQKGGVVRLVYLAAFVIPKGQSAIGGMGQFPPWSIPTETIGGNVGPQGGYLNVDNPAHIMYSDLDPDKAKHWASRIKHEATPVYSCPMAYEPWHDIDCAYFVCDGDQALPPQFQNMMAGALGEKAVVRHFKAGHCPFLSQPESIADALIELDESEKGKMSSVEPRWHLPVGFERRNG